MNKIPFLASAVGLVASVALAQSLPGQRIAPASGPSLRRFIPGEAVPGRLLVGHRPGADIASDRNALRIENMGARWTAHQGGINVSVVEVDPSRQEEVRRSLEQSRRFTFVEPDYVAHSMATPNDPDYLQQWHLPIIQAPNAWNLATGKPSVPIAMIDSGVEPTHPDLVPNLVAGWSFLTGTSDTHDVLGHGTSTAGTAAAAGNNAIGVSGVAWNVSIMPLVVLDSTNYASYSNIAAAIQYAADHGVRVASVSIGGTSSSSTLQSAVNYAWNKGTVVIAAAGNYGSSAPIYPGACTNVVAVTATDSTDSFVSWSSYGTWVSLAAPGAGVFTTGTGGGYGPVSGTSFSAPIVAGVAALVLSENPSLTAQALVSILEQNADDLGTPGFDQYFGYGRVNAARAVAAAGGPPPDSTPPTVSISGPSSSATVQSQVQVLGTATDNVGVTGVELDADGTLVSTEITPAFSFSWDSTSVPNGLHTLTVKAHDAAGNVGESSVTVNVNNTVPNTTPPTVTITAPSASSTVSGTVAVQGISTDQVGVTNVQFYADGALISSAATPSFSFNWNAAAAANGGHTLMVKAYDAAGNVGQASVTVTVNNPPAPGDTIPPTVRILSPSSGSNVWGGFTVSATATDNVGVTHMAVYVNGVQYAACPSASCSASVNPHKLSSSTGTITVQAWDASGNVGSASVLVKVAH